MTSFRRKRGTYKVQEDTATPSKASKKKMMTCFVDLLDDNTMNIEIERQSRGSSLLDETFKRLDLVEKDYFGLVYIDNESGLTCWLEPHKKIRKQNRGEHILKFRFCVKFYVTEPGKLSEEYTRYLFYLQSKQDLYTGRLQCAPVTATQLASYVVQAELGDYNSLDHTDGYVSELRLLQDQSSAVEEEIADLHRGNAGMRCEDAEYKFLEMAKRLPMYGVDLHPAIDHDGIHLQLGVMASGIIVYLQDNKINSFSWAKIIKISFKKKRFYIHIRSDTDDKYQSRIIGFKIVPYRACKNVWKRCVEYHTFFRLNTPRDIPSRGVLRLGSKYHYKGRTQKQAIEDYNNYIRTNSSFERTPSKRVSRRKGADNNNNNNNNSNNNNNHDNNRRFFTPNSTANNDNTTPTKNIEKTEVSTPDFVTPTRTDSPNHHGSTPSDISREEALEYDTKTGQINQNNSLNTSTPSVNLQEELEKEEDMVEIAILPDPAGKFGFNVRGGFDQKIPVVVSKVARASPAAAAEPCLEENDQVISINHTAVDTLAHSQIVGMIQSSSSQFGKLTLVVRKHNSESLAAEKLTIEDNASSRDVFELPELPKFNAETANLLDSSITILQKSLQDSTLSNKFNNLYRQTPGVTMVAAKLDENHSKNRFRDTLPYDTTRVRLQEGNDYINASYVDVQVGSEQLSYIASQGPMSSTIDDHWQMIWEQEVELIVMVTECIEKNSVKCSQYWPEPTQTIQYRNLAVCCVSQTQLDCAATERQLEVACGGTTKCVTHLQFTGWPHKGAVPEECREFTNFVRLVSERRKGVETPLLVHCSAGIGRTGVVLLLEGALDLIRSKSGVYPLDMVTALRDQRPKLIQTFSMFKFACECILLMYSEETNKVSEKENGVEEGEFLKDKNEDANNNANIITSS